MQPRLKSSTKWTDFPKEYSDQIAKVFQDNFQAQLGGSRLIIEGRIYKEEVVLRVGILQKGELRQANFEVSMDYSAKEKDAMERIANCIDAAASMMTDYFENEGEVDFPRSWKAYPFEKQTVYLQFSTENSELEAAADKLLGESDDGMVHESEGGEDDPDDDGSPRMFKGKAPNKKLH